MYRQSTIKRTATTVCLMSDAEKRQFVALLDRKAARQQATKRTAARTVKADNSTAWKLAPASDAQIERIRGKEARLNLPLTPSNGAGMNGQEAREWNTALNAKLGYKAR